MKEYKSFEIKSFDLNEETNEMFVEGYAAVFNIPDTAQPMLTATKEIVMVSDILESGATTKTIQERGSRIAFLVNHNMDNPVAKILELKEDAYGLFIRVRISDSEDDLKTKIKEGIYTEFSYGFKTIRSEVKKQDDGSFLRYLKEIKIFEISIVTIARHEMAKITGIKSLSDAGQLFDTVIEQENDEAKKYNLLQLKSLLIDAPPLEVPIEQKPSITIDEFKSIIHKNLN